MMRGFYTGKAVIEHRRWSTPPYVVHRVRVEMRKSRRGRQGVPAGPFALGRRLRRAQEGVMWAHGHDGEDVEALIVSAALR
jgi:hypothetical protein